MREDRFFVNLELKKGKIEIGEKRIFHQLKNVLRKGVGEKIILFDGKMNEAISEIKKISRDKIEVEILEIKKNEKEPKISVSLFCSILKKSNFELVCQKATEVGVKEIVPIICKRTIKTGLNLERLKKIIIEATEQSQRGILPKLISPKKFKDAIEIAKDFDLKILFDISGKNFFEIKFEKPQKIAIFIGPEGGWDRKEIELAKKESFKILNLGNLNLRAETAATVASFLAINFLNCEK